MIDAKMFAEGQRRHASQRRRGVRLSNRRIQSHSLCGSHHACDNARGTFSGRRDADGLGGKGLIVICIEAHLL